MHKTFRVSTPGAMQQIFQALRTRIDSLQVGCISAHDSDDRDYYLTQLTDARAALADAERSEAA